MCVWVATDTAYGDQHPCESGTYNNVTGIDAPEQCEDCPVGYYCPEASEEPTECPAYV